MMFAIKAEVSDPCAETFAFNAQKTMYGGKHIAKGDTIFVFASEHETGHRAANTPREHHHQAHRAREAAPRPDRAQIVFRLERR